MRARSNSGVNGARFEPVRRLCKSTSSLREVVGLGLLVLIPQPELRDSHQFHRAEERERANPGRTGDDSELSIRETRIDQDSSNLLVPSHSLSFSHIGINIVRPLQAYSYSLVSWECSDGFDDCQPEEVLNEDDS